MTRRWATGRYDFLTDAADDTTQWDEREGAPRLEEMQALGRYSGDIEADATGRSLVARLSDGGGVVTSITRVVGSLDGRSGSFVLRHEGTRKPTTWEGSQWVIPGSGTGGLAGLRGEGDWLYQHDANDYSWTLDYWFE